MKRFAYFIDAQHLAQVMDEYGASMFTSFLGEDSKGRFVIMDVAEPAKKTRFYLGNNLESDQFHHIMEQTGATEMELYSGMSHDGLCWYTDIEVKKPTIEVKKPTREELVGQLWWAHKPTDRVKSMLKVITLPQFWTTEELQMLVDFQNETTKRHIDEWGELDSRSNYYKAIRGHKDDPQYAVIRHTVTSPSRWHPTLAVAMAAANSVEAIKEDIETLKHLYEQAAEPNTDWSRGYRAGVKRALKCLGREKELD